MPEMIGVVKKFFFNFVKIKTISSAAALGTYLDIEDLSN